MRRLPGFLLLMLVFTLSVAACGDTKPAAPADVVASWSQAINASGDDTAAGLFAPAAS